MAGFALFSPVVSQHNTLTGCPDQAGVPARLDRSERSKAIGHERGGGRRIDKLGKDWHGAGICILLAAQTLELITAQVIDRTIVYGDLEQASFDDLSVELAGPLTAAIPRP